MDRTPEEIVEAAFGIKLSKVQVESRKWRWVLKPPPRVWDSRPRAESDRPEESGS